VDPLEGSPELATMDDSIFIHHIRRQQQDDTTPWLMFTEWP
jgi:hypothetical protein